MELCKLNFTKFDYFDDLLEIPTNSLFFRGVSENISNDEMLKRPIIFLASNENAAREYGNGTYRSVRTKKSIKVMDLRKVGSLLSIMLDFIPAQNDTVLMCLMASFGFITDMTTQYECLKTISEQNPNEPKLRDATAYFQNKLIEKKDKYNIVFNPKGVRFSITTIDVYAYMACKQIFGEFFDGIISPNLYTIESNSKPFQGCELVLFEPHKCLEVVNENEYKVLEKHLTTMLLREYGDFTFTFNGTHLMKGFFYLGGGGKKDGESPDKNSFFDEKRNTRKVNTAVNKFVKTLPIQLTTFKKEYFKYHINPKYGLSTNPNSFFDDKQDKIKINFKI